MHKLCIATISPLAAILARSQCNYLVWEVSNLNLHVQEESQGALCKSNYLTWEVSLFRNSSWGFEEGNTTVREFIKDWGVNICKKVGSKLKWVWLFSKTELRTSFSNVADVWFLLKKRRERSIYMYVNSVVINESAFI